MGGDVKEKNTVSPMEILALVAGKTQSERVDWLARHILAHAHTYLTKEMLKGYDRIIEAVLPEVPKAAGKNVIEYRIDTLRRERRKWKSRWQLRQRRMYSKYERR